MPVSGITLGVDGASARVCEMLLAVDVRSVLLELKMIRALTMNAIAPRPRIELHAEPVSSKETFG